MGCFNDDILFIHIPKTGGTSVKGWLFENVPGMQGQDPHFEPDPEGVFPIGHIPLRDVERYSGRSPESFKLIFATLRLPYDQQLSQWLFWRDRYARIMRADENGEVKRIAYQHVNDICAASHPTIESWLKDPGCDFHLWYEAHHGKSPEPRESVVGSPIDGYQDFGGYYFYWISVNGELPDNLRLVEMKDMNETIPKMLKPFYGDLPSIGHVNPGPSRSATYEYYTPEAVAIVESKFRWAFDNMYDRWLDR